MTSTSPPHLNEIASTLRDRAEDTRAVAESRVAESRELLTRLPGDLPFLLLELKERLGSDVVQKFAETSAAVTQAAYNRLIQRGEAALERLRDSSEPRIRTVGERPAKLVGSGLSKKSSARKAAAKQVSARTSVKKASAKKAAAKRSTREK